jgi:hypothetical protein
LQIHKTQKAAGNLPKQIKLRSTLFIYTYMRYLCEKLTAMDAKLTLSFDADVISKAKEFALKNKISLSRLIEFLLAQTTSGNYSSLEDLPISDWVLKVSEGEIEYKSKNSTRKSLRNEFLSAKK